MSSFEKIAGFRPFWTSFRGRVIPIMRKGDKPQPKKLVFKLCKLNVISKIKLYEVTIK